MKRLSIIAIILSILAIAGQVFIFAMPKGMVESEVAMEEKAMGSHRGHEHRGMTIYAPRIPDSMDFCGERVPLELYYVRESFDRELIVNTMGHTSTLLYFKRANRYFPVIEPILERNGVPNDFKYLCVIESGLTNATSPAKAQGFWQFMKTTGQQYGLEINDEVDMRNDLEASTEAACKFLKKLRNDLGSWTAAAAAYNCGGGGLSKNFSRQSVRSYYETRLNSETTRYVYRILAVKYIMQHPQQCGFYLRHCDLYSEVPYSTTTLTGQNIDLYEYAKSHHTTYKLLREYNPWMISEKIVNKGGKSYTVRLPKEKGLKMEEIAKEKDRSTEYITSM